MVITYFTLVFRQIWQNICLYIYMIVLLSAFCKTRTQTSVLGVTYILGVIYPYIIHILYYIHHKKVSRGGFSLPRTYLRWLTLDIYPSPENIVASLLISGGFWRFHSRFHLKIIDDLENIDLFIISLCTFICNYVIYVHCEDFNSSYIYCILKVPT